jgi:hypothetical protein
VNYAIIQKDLYDMSEAIDAANKKSQSGFVIIGATYVYYSDTLDTPWLEE